MNSLKRIQTQARELQFFDQILTFDEKKLSKEFQKKHKGILNKNVRGFGNQR